MEIWIAREGKSYGPYQEEQIRQWIGDGSISTEDMALRRGDANWVPLHQLLNTSVNHAGRRDQENSNRAALPSTEGPFASSNVNVPRRKSGLSATALTAVVIGIILVMAGFLFVLVGYQDSQIRAQVAEATSIAEPLKTALAEYYSSNGNYPANNAVAGLQSPNSFSSDHISKIEVGDGRIIATFGNKADSKLTGHHFTFKASVDAGGTIQWQCGSSDIEPKYLPTNCRDRLPNSLTANSETTKEPGLSSKLTAATQANQVQTSAGLSTKIPDSADLVSAQVEGAAARADQLKTAFGEFYAQNAKYPANNAVAGLQSPESFAGDFVSRVEVGDGRITATFGNNADAKLAGRHFFLQASADRDGTIHWQCGSPDIESQYLPTSCADTPPNSSTPNTADNPSLSSTSSAARQANQGQSAVAVTNQDADAPSAVGTGNPSDDEVAMAIAAFVVGGQSCDLKANEIPMATALGKLGQNLADWGPQGKHSELVFEKMKDAKNQVAAGKTAACGAMAVTLHTYLPDLYP